MYVSGYRNYVLEIYGWAGVVFGGNTEEMKLARKKAALVFFF